MFKDYFFLAIRNIGRRKTRSWLTMIGIFIGIAAVVSLISLGDGLRSAVTGQFSFIGTDKIVISPKGAGMGPPGSDASSPLTKDDYEVIKGIYGIKKTSYRWVRPVKVEFNDAIAYPYALGIPKGDVKELIFEMLNAEPENGRMIRDSDKHKVTIGSNLATKDNYNGKSISVGDKILIQDIEFEVIGVLEKKGTFTLDDSISVTEDAMDEFYDLGDDVDALVAQFYPGTNVDLLIERVEKAMRKERNEKEGEETFTVETPEAALKSLDTILGFVQTVVTAIAMFALLVGAINISNTMFTSVLERRKEIGIMKAIGAKNRDVLWIFLIESGLMGLSGGVIGILLGMGFSKLVQFGSKAALGTDLLVPEFKISVAIGVLIFSFVVGTLAGIVPARQAAKMNPVNALRGGKK